ncbi:uncharacterized protein At3g28850-like isoform X2 [Cucurbita moschata]|uniref:Uncharacterized protein At3g28850-like isoform X2 n=1 Tax=Cucurbita moschata TaxID=3662 RepID=A0A6J1F1Y2_CUCMO|nr:uncharacterized protein At3g28850-like isoform X2 [Cucurbita moschata]
MGCVNSKPNRCRHCRRPYSPISRSYSMQVHHPPQAKGDSYHVVALTSSTLGSLELGSGGGGGGGSGSVNYCCQSQRSDNSKTIEDFRMGLAEAKTWSNIIREKIPKTASKTPIRTPPGEPETINIWELMEGLEDVSPLWSPSRYRSFSFDFGSRTYDYRSLIDQPKPIPKQNGTDSSHKPLWLRLKEEKDEIGDGNLNSDSMASDFDPEVISSFRKSLQQLTPDHSFYLRPVENTKHQQPPLAAVESKKFYSWPEEKKRDKVILYFTSLRGIRKTYEDCCDVRSILRAIGIRVDERDVSMHNGFKEELKQLLMEDQKSLPRVFIGRKQIGGAEEIRRLHEDGQLEKLLECCEKLENDDGGVCEACGDIRFVPCETCSGSCKVFYEEEEEEEAEDGYGFQRCTDCNENGLVRCPICCH